MGIRGELFSTRMSCEGRTYFFNVKQNRMGDLFLTIVESKPTEAETFDRRSIVVFRDDMRGFLKALQAALDHMEKPGKKPATSLSFFPEPEEEAAPPARAPEAGPERKRRIVVKRKPAEGKDPEASSKDGAGDPPAED